MNAITAIAVSFFAVAAISASFTIDTTKSSKAESSSPKSFAAKPGGLPGSCCSFVLLFDHQRRNHYLLHFGFSAQR